MPSIKLFDSLEIALKEIPNRRMVGFNVDQARICVVNFDNKLYALNNSCPHLGETLSKGTTNHLGEVICPWHSYRFNLKTGEEALKRCGDVEIYPIRVEDGVFVELG